MLRLADLDARSRMLARISVAVCLVMGTLLVCFAVGITVPGGTDDIVAAGPVPRALIVLTYLSLAGAAATVATGAVRTGWRWRRGTLVFVAVLGAFMAAKTVEAAELVETYRLILIGRELLPAAVPRVLEALGWAALAASILVGVSPLRLARRLGWWWSLFAAAPFVIALSAYLVAAVAAAGVQQFPEVKPANAVVASAVVALVFGIGFWNAALLLWQAAMSARGARDAGTPIAVQLGGRPRLLEAVVGAKLLWVILGIAGVLPALLGGGEDRWDSSREDGIFAWTFAVLLSAAAGYWLTRRRPVRLPGNGLVPAVAAIAAGLLAALLLAAAALFGFGIVAVDAGSSMQQMFFDVGNWAADRIILAQVLTVVMAAIAGAVLVLRSRTTVSVFLVLFAVWAAPRTISVAWEQLADQPVMFGRVDLITLDVAITVLGAVLLGLARYRGTNVDRALLALVLLVSTALVHTAWLLTAISEEAAFYIGLLFAPLFLFLFGADELNRPGQDRAARVLRATGLAAGLLTLVTVQVAAGTLAPGTSSYGELGRLLIAVPMAAVLIASQRLDTSIHRPNSPTPSAP